VISQEKLLKVIDADLVQCTKIRQSDIPGATQQNIEHLTLLQHLKMAQEAADDQAKLEAVVASLEKNPVLGRYQHWRELSEA
jgi:hypothetical protein